MTGALAAGVRVGRARHFLGTWDARAALRLGEGIERERDAFVPRNVWRSLTDDEAAVLIVPLDGPAPDIAVFTTPNWLRADFWALDLERVLAPSASASPGTTEFSRYATRVVEFLRFIDVPLGASASMRVSATAPGKPAADAPARNGLHLPARRASGSTALVNVGDATRSLVFINVRADTDAAARAFMAAQMDYPVTRLLLEPGQGCFGVLDTIPHDGHAMDMGAPDVCLEVASGEAA